MELLTLTSASLIYYIYMLIFICAESQNVQMISETTYSRQIKLIGQSKDKVIQICPFWPKKA